MSDLAAIEKVIGMQIPVGSGTPWSGHKPAKGSVKKRKKNKSRPGEGRIGDRRRTSSKKESATRIFRR